VIVTALNLWIPAFAGMTSGIHWVTVMPDLIRHPAIDDEHQLEKIGHFRKNLIANREDTTKRKEKIDEHY